jgi:hypothetical protein
MANDRALPPYDAQELDVYTKTFAAVFAFRSQLNLAELSDAQIGIHAADVAGRAVEQYRRLLKAFVG